ncbi:hypothetical protein LCGC14_0633530 [marine sediment metagenome]|uniref:HTH araC/xylS-type domain-containing protein n=1 Tax=marine sediment metagenome TaxID=412755 RepID=A0A0F9RKM3_9ZZZZ|nr:helix-turn-helix domain-containing protein [Methylophaga aminisulfidivorans]
MHMQSSVFHDVNQHARSLQNWPQEYDQITSGEFEGSIDDIQLDAVRIFRERMKQSIIQNTHTPNGKINFMIPNHIDAGKTSDQARQVLSKGITLLPYDSDFSFVAPPEMDYTVISIAHERLRRLLSDSVYQHLITTDHSYGVTSNEAVVTAVRQNMLNIMSKLAALTAKDQENLPETERKIKTLHDEIIYIVMQLCDFGLEGTSSPKRLGNQHNYIVQRCHDYVISEEGSCASIVDICEMLNIPHRTLNYSFKKATGLSPMQYIRAVKLNAARRELLHSHLQVTDIAANYGFYHMGYFSQEYRRLFGDTPSMTRKAFA